MEDKMFTKDLKYRSFSRRRKPVPIFSGELEDEVKL
jgi:hypothetical protein